MTTNLIALVTVIYGATAASFLFDGKLGWAICFSGYALANVGIILASR
jgi:hypothetical protein